MEQGAENINRLLEEVKKINPDIDEGHFLNFLLSTKQVQEAGNDAGMSPWIFTMLFIAFMTGGKNDGAEYWRGRYEELRDAERGHG